MILLHENYALINKRLLNCYKVLSLICFVPDNAQQTDKWEADMLF
jgi:hypothetical protein